MSQVLQLKITLEGIDPPIWRRFLIDDSINFKKLHKIIQIIMGWEDYHLYNFQIDKITYIEASQDSKNQFAVDAMWSGFKSGSEKKKYKDNEAIVSDFINKEKQKILYTYDFGDSWEHLINVEKIFPKEADKKYPLCIDGARACPPEDCGGIWGYQELLEILKDPRHPEYEERIEEWLGGDFDPEEFNLENINKKLKNIRYGRA
ncbi:MAG: plasmid pRiA4b ORF-3 family protein [uncultured bacterium]|nr:MAG: plasmid pRiA4b ORF-3 family protein [uncultured bacterium]